MSSYLIFFSTHHIPLYHLYLELFSISYSLVEILVSLRWYSGLTAESEQFSSEAPDFIACSGASYQLMCVQGVQLTSVLALINIRNKKSCLCMFILVVLKHTERRRN